MTFNPSSLVQSWPLPANPRPIVIFGAGSIVGDAHFPAYRKAGFPVVISETPKANGKNFRVRVGPFADRAAADAAAIKLRRDQRLDTWLTDSP